MATCGPAKLTPARNAFSGIDLSKVNPGSFQFLVCGKTGVGKSSLINSLVGAAICNVNDPGDVSGGTTGAASFAPGTLEVSSTSILVTKGAPVLAWDSPGLQDGSGNEDRYLQNMCEKCKDVDVVFYCMEMTSVRLTDQDRKATRVLTQKFGYEFWKKTVLVLTKANMVASEKGKGYHQGLYSNLLKNFAEILTREGVPREVADTIHCVAAGIFDESDLEENERFIWYASDKANSQNNEKIDFLPELWALCFQVLSGKSHDEIVVKSRTRKVETPAEAAARKKCEDEEQHLKMEKLRQKAEKEKQERMLLEARRLEREREHQRNVEALQRRIQEEERAKKAAEALTPQQKILNDWKRRREMQSRGVIVNSTSTDFLQPYKFEPHIEFPFTHHFH